MADSQGEKATSLYKKVLSTAQEMSSTIQFLRYDVKKNLARSYWRIGQRHKAKDAMLELLAVLQQEGLPEDNRRLRREMDLAVARWNSGDLRDALKSMRDAVATTRR
jgi:hypothetical protein